MLDKEDNRQALQDDTITDVLGSTIEGERFGEMISHRIRARIEDRSDHNSPVINNSKTMTL